MLSSGSSPGYMKQQGIKNTYPASDLVCVPERTGYVTEQVVAAAAAAAPLWTARPLCLSAAGTPLDCGCADCTTQSSHLRC